MAAEVSLEYLDISNSALTGDEFELKVCQPGFWYANAITYAEHETERVQELSKRLQVPLTVKNFVQSHTPFQQLVHGSNGTEGLEDKVVLVTGGHGQKCRTVAEK